MSLLRASGVLARPLFRGTVLNVARVTSPTICAVGSTIVPIQSMPVAVDNTVWSRGYKNFGHKPQPLPKVTRLYYFFILGLFLYCTVDWMWIYDYFFPPVDADAGTKRGSVKDQEENDSEESANKSKELNKKSKKDKVGFRDRKIIEYENRIRQFSTPDKVFRYFATIQVTHPNGEMEIFMTPTDFITSMTPGIKQPDGLGLDQYIKYDPKTVTANLNLQLEKDSIFYKLGSYGLISFSDYIFLLTVLSTSHRHFQIAFQMFDLNGDGNVDSEEFEMVANLIRQQTSFGSRHRDHTTTGNMFKGVNSALTHFFFGKDMRRKLTIEKFLEFQKRLQNEILTLEFKRKNPNADGKIAERDFAELLVAYAGYTETKKNKKLKRVKRKFRDHGKGISLQEYLDFFKLLHEINDVDTALTFYNIAGASIGQETFKHVARTVAHINLSDHVIEVVYTLFDEDGDGQLSNREFVAVMKNRLMRGLEKPKDTGFVKFMYSILKCANETKPALLDW